MSDLEREWKRRIEIELEQEVARLKSKLSEAVAFCKEAMAWKRNVYEDWCECWACRMETFVRSLEAKP